MTTYDEIFIDGDQDTTQLRVQGHTTQTNPLQTWEGSDGTPLGQISGDGRLELGTLDMGTPDALVEANHDIDLTLPSSVPLRGVQSLGLIRGAVSNAIAWAVHELELLGTGGVSGLHAALRAKISQKNTGDADLAELRAGDFEAINEAGSDLKPVGKLVGVQSAVTNEQAAYLTEAVGVGVQINHEGGPSQLTRAYGLHIADMPAVEEKAYAIHTGKGAAYVGDHLEMAPLAVGDIPSNPSAGVLVYSKAADNKLYARNPGGEYELGPGGGGVVDHGALTGLGDDDHPQYHTDARGDSRYFQKSEHLAASAGSPDAGKPIKLNASGQIDTSMLPPAGACEGRLTLTSGVPITTGGVTAAPTLYFTPYKGNRVALYNGTRWVLYAFAERSLPLTELSANTNYDIFLYDNSSTLTLEAVAWTNDTTRATDLVKPDGIYVKTGDATRRYLGTIRTTAAGQTEDSVTKRYVYNENNQVPRMLKVVEPVDQWSYSTNAWRAAHNNVANRVGVVIGNVGPLVGLDLMVRMYGQGAGGAQGIAYDAVNTNHADVFPNVPLNALAAAHLQHYPAIGYHYYQWVENGRGQTNTMYGYAANGFQSGMVGEVML